MYGCVQSPQAFNKTLFKKFKEMGMIQSRAELCIQFNKDDLTLIVACYVDNLIITGEENEINKFKTKLNKRFEIKDLGEVKKHLGVWYKKRDNEYELTMDKYCQDIANDWKQLTGSEAKTASTPGFPGETLCKNEGPPIEINTYRQILGKLMQVTKKLMPEYCNPLRELASIMDHPGEQHWKALERVVGYIKKRSS